jgi:hypothetical protein
MTSVVRIRQTFRFFARAVQSRHAVKGGTSLRKDSVSSRDLIPRRAQGSGESRPSSSLRHSAEIWSYGDLGGDCGLCLWPQVCWRRSLLEQSHALSCQHCAEQRKRNCSSLHRDFREVGWSARWGVVVVDSGRCLKMWGLETKRDVAWQNKIACSASVRGGHTFSSSLQQRPCFDSGTVVVPRPSHRHQAPIPGCDKR